VLLLRLLPKLLPQKKLLRLPPKVLNNTHLSGIYSIASEMSILAIASLFLLLTPPIFIKTKSEDNLFALFYFKTNFASV
jgi:hypothetical protein